ncbi:Yip1 family protein [Natrarchaeobius chitinivorans]|uniref:YIP1 family protein n=1 Tax=Natrarchaeobius chitinivorans TaxID=1679083 RepID=A0A3N6LT63_NATCH|nr:Yip1 family protein [Natrarchaeobius chitinivorans]RQG90594.1 YIP1 family protein [Natrarchaeobius chitinivorans]
MPSILRSIRTFLLAPQAFFDERPPAETLALAVGIVVVLALALAFAIALIGSMLAGSVDATVTMDNPDRPPEWVCDQHEDDPDSILGENCDEPATIERDAGALVQEAAHEYVPIALISPFIMWILGGIVLFATGRLAGGDPSVAGSFALAGWAAVPEFARLAAVLLGFWIVLRDVTITDPESQVDVIEGAMTSLEPFFLVVSLLVLVWQWYLLAGGLSRDANVPWRTAAFAVAVPLALLVPFTVF